MSGNPDRKGERVGPYRLLKRYRGIEPDEGPIYEARHVETGAPAMVMLPGPGADGPPKSAWRVLAESSLQPPYRALRVERAPRGRTSALHELTLLLIQLAGAVAHVEKRRDARAYFTQKPFPRRHVLRWGGAGLGLAAAVVLTVFLRPHTQGEAQTAGGDPVIFSNGEMLTLPVASYPMPEAPFKEQRKPPCLDGTEVEIRGGCWIEHTKKSPCPRSTAAFQGKCYIPVKKPDPAPTSVQP